MENVGLWRNRNFLLLFFAQVISLLGSGVTTVGLALFAYQLTGGESAAIVIGNALFLRILAFLLFSQPAGIIADRLHRKYILIAADLIRFALLALFPFITEIWQIYGLIFLINAVTAFFTPTFEASLPSVVGDEHYVKALSYSRVAVDAETVAAPALAGLLVAAFGVRSVFWFDAATYLVSAALVLAATIPLVANKSVPLSVQNFFAEITHGTRVLFKEGSLRQALILSFAEATAGAAAIVATIVYVTEILKQNETAYTILMAVLGAGSALAAILLGRVTARFEKSENDAGVGLHTRRHIWTRRALLLGGAVLGLILLPGIFEPPLILFGFLWFLNGAGQALIGIPSATLLAEHTAEDERGRAYAAHFALTHACWLVTYPAIGYAAERFGTPLTFTTAGILCLLITAAAFFLGGNLSINHSHAGRERAAKI